jgi:hypothetical protein
MEFGIFGYFQIRNQHRNSGEVEYDLRSLNSQEFADGPEKNKIIEGYWGYPDCVRLFEIIC